MTRVITVPAIQDVGGRYRGIRYASEFNGICCPSLRQARGKQALWNLCHVCWRSLQGCDVHIWKDHIYHIDCGEAPPMSLKGSDR